MQQIPHSRLSLREGNENTVTPAVKQTACQLHIFLGFIQILF